MDIVLHNSIPDILNKISTLQMELANRISSEGESYIFEVLQPIFAVSPSIKAITWRQYTPFFNDGDPCEFTVHWEGEILIDSLYLEEGVNVEDFSEWGNGCLSGWMIKHQADNSTPILDPNHWTSNRIETFLLASKEIEFLFYKPIYTAPTEKQGILQDVLKLLFGDHVAVTAMRDGTFNVEYYEHD